MSMIQEFARQAIKENPEVAAREVPEILGHYCLDNTRLNRIKDAAVLVVIQPDKCNLDRLAQAIREAEDESCV